MTMTRDIWCTLGPSSLNDHVIGRLEEAGVSLLRLNLSHTRIDELPQTLEYVQSRTKLPLCLDTEGAQIRTSPAGSVRSMRTDRSASPTDRRG